MKFKVFYTAMLFFCYIGMMQASTCQEQQNANFLPEAEILLSQKKLLNNDRHSSFISACQKEAENDKENYESVLLESFNRLVENPQIKTEELAKMRQKLTRVTTTYNDNGQWIYKTEDLKIGKELNKIYELEQAQVLGCCCWTVKQDPSVIQARVVSRSVLLKRAIKSRLEEYCENCPSAPPMQIATYMVMERDNDSDSSSEC